jgi:amino acid adenylation domain-containing protein
MRAGTETEEIISRAPHLDSYNDAQSDYPADSCIHQLFEAQVERTPDRIAVVFEDKRLTYRELNARANRLARQLRSLGVGPEQLAGVFVERSIEMVIALLGILKAGGAYVPLDPSYPKDRLAFMIEDAGLAMLVSERRSIERLPDHGAKVVCADSIPEHSSQNDDENLIPEATGENLAYVIYTSGSTGKPKAVQIPHRAVVNLLTSMRRQPGLSPSDILLSVTTISFDISVLEIFLPLITGARLVVADRETASDGARLAEAIARFGATTLQATPATWRLLLAAGWQGDGRLRIFCGGEALAADLAAQLLERGSCVWNLYGPTETTIWSSAYRVNPGDKIILIGRPIANTQMYLLDERLRPVDAGTAAELYIGGAGLARGYRNRPELTAERFIPVPLGEEAARRLYRTGDLARYLPDGNIECLGRIDHQVKIRGYRVELGEIEAAIRQHPCVRESVVAAREDAPGDRRLAAYVVLDREGAIRGGELRRFLSERLPDYMVPSAFVELEAMPLTLNGKIDRRALPAPARRRERSSPAAAARDPLEHQLVQIWEDVLNVRPIGVSDNFFEVGGNSLLAAQMMAEVEQACGKRVPLDRLYGNATIESLADMLLKLEGHALQSPIVEVRAGGSRRPFFFLHGDHSGGGFYCLNLARRLDRGQPFYVIPPHGVDGGRIPPTIEEMAGCRLASLRAFQPQGPYLLGGFCNGALVAYEMARLLEAAGERIDLLALVYVSATNTRLGTAQSLIRSFDRLFGIGPEKQLEHFLFLRSRLSRLSELSRGRASSTGRRSAGPELPARQGGSEGIQRVIRWDITAKYDTIMDGYVPRRYGGRISLFWPEEAEPECGDDPTMGWRKVAGGGVELYKIAGKHLTCITRHVDVLADRLNACLEKAQAEQ